MSDFLDLECLDCGRIGCWGVTDKVPWEDGDNITYYLKCECGSEEIKDIDLSPDGIELFKLNRDVDELYKD